MPQANDSELTRLITVHTGSTVEDPAPNTPPPGSPNAQPTFDLHLEAVAGNVVGSSGEPYTLTITAVDVTAGGGIAGLKPTGGGVNTTNGQSFSGPLWSASGPAEFVTNQTFTINVPGGVSGHVFIYTASLVSKNFDQASFIQSSPFVLV
jgi:hypothetical protein